MIRIKYYVVVLELCRRRIYCRMKIRSTFSTDVGAQMLAVLHGIANLEISIM